MHTLEIHDISISVHVYNCNNIIFLKCIAVRPMSLNVGGNACSRKKIQYHDYSPFQELQHEKLHRTLNS